VTKHLKTVHFEGKQDMAAAMQLDSIPQALDVWYFEATMLCQLVLQLLHRPAAANVVQLLPA
jgi:hypothetical protein